MSRNIKTPAIDELYPVSTNDLPPITLITSCSATRTITPKISVADMPEGLNMAEALDWWHSTMSAIEPEITPREQYRGLGFATLVKLQEAFPAVEDIKIITGGLGLTDLDEPIVPYDFTADKNEEHNIWQKVTKEPFVTTLWWKMINQVRGHGSTPIANLVRSRPDDLVLIAASKVFLRYCAEDILSLGVAERTRVRILLAASSVGSVPMQLRPMMIPFDRGSVAHMVGNRNDTNHRAAFLFLDHCYRERGFIGMAPSLQANRFIAEGYQTGDRVSPEELEQILQDNPAYLKMDAETAYKYVRRSHGALGGRILFRSIFRRLGGGGEQPEVPVAPEELDRAKQALVGMHFLTAPTTTPKSDESEAIRGLQIFAEALHSVAPKAVFTAADIVSWAASYFADEDRPELMSSPNKLVHVLKNNVDIVGMEEVQLPSGRAYQLQLQHSQ